MPKVNKTFLSNFSIKNPLARIVYSSAPIASAFFVELTKHLSNPNEQQVLISALTAAGIVLTPVAGIAGNVLADAIERKLFQSFFEKRYFGKRRFAKSRRRCDLRHRSCCSRRGTKHFQVKTIRHFSTIERLFPN